MTFSLAVSNGDLVRKGSQLGIVHGSDKLKQDLTLWLSERYGIDRFHPAMGSNFQNYIGGIISYSTRATIYSEAMRVLDNYQKVQFQSMRAAPQLYSLSELLWSINEVNVGVGFDSVSVNVSVSNASSETTTIVISQGA